MFSIDSGISMSPKLQAHEWAPVCSFRSDVTPSVRVGRSVSQQVFSEKKKNCVPAHKDEAMLDLPGWATGITAQPKSMSIICRSVQVILSVFG